MKQIFQKYFLFRNRKFQALLCLHVICNVLYAQATFQKSYTGNVYGPLFIQQTNVHGFINLGTTYSFGAGDKDVYLYKTDSMGNYLWGKSYGGSLADAGTCVKHTSDGGFIISANTNSFSSNYDIYLIRTDSVGDTLWTKTYGGTGFEESHSVIQDNDGGFIIAGESYSFGNFGVSFSYADIYLIKTDANGNVVWSKVIGGTIHDYCHIVQRTTDGGLILMGETYSFGMGGYDTYLVKTDSIGNVVWSKTYGTTSLWEVANSGHQTADSGFILSGYRDDTTGGNNIYLLKMDISGNLSWSRTMKVLGNSSGVDAIWSDTQGNSVRQTSDGNYILAGNRDTVSGPGNDIFLIKTDSSGNLLHSKIYNLPGYFKRGFSAIETNDGGYIEAGQNFDNGSVYLIKTDSSCSSGCLEYEALTYVLIPPTLIPPTLITSPTTLEMSGPITSANPATIVSIGNEIATNICASVDIIELSEKNICSLYPNPAKNVCTYEITLQESQNGSIKIYDLRGKLLKSLSLKNGDNIATIDLSAFSNGIYMCQTVINGEAVEHKKLVIGR
jgi:hypothetical protein